MKKLTLTCLILALTTGAAPAGDLIRKACLKSGRPSATSAMCRCIQATADTRLNRKDQKLAASFFADPHKAQEIRQSDNTSHEAFWQRYKQWAAVAEDSCKSLG